MACTDPRTAWAYGTTINGKQNYVFKEPEDSWHYEKQKIPCGQCVSCKLQKAAEWATRAYHESTEHLNNCFITLTYAPEHLPENESLSIRDFDNFIKNLRTHLSEIRINPDTGRKKRYYNNKWKYLACGEYGEKLNRPHYHLCLFGVHFSDIQYKFSNNLGQPVYTSETLNNIWKKGITSVCEFSYNTAAYTARYTLKKAQTEDGKKAQEEITYIQPWEQVGEFIDKKTGEIYDQATYEYYLKRINKTPEFVRMSRGIGKNWYLKYKTDTDKDYIRVNYKKHKIPRYYDKLREQEDPESLEQLKLKRKEKAKELQADNTVNRRKSKDIIINQSKDKLKRTLDNGN